MNNKLNTKQYYIYDRAFMMFGSIMNAFQSKLNKEDLEFVKKVWEFCVEQTQQFVEKLYEESKNSNENNELPL